MDKKIEADSVPAYACLIVGKVDFCFQHTPEIILKMRLESCETCGYPNHDAGPLCARCEALEELKREAMFLALQDHLHPRHVHVFGIGYVDPWTREGKQYLDP